MLYIPIAVVSLNQPAMRVIDPLNDALGGLNIISFLFYESPPGPDGLRPSFRQEPWR